MHITVIGAGLAGCECAYTLARHGINVRLYDMKPDKRSPAHSEDTFAELVCSNSLKAERINSASGLLKAEMRRMGSLLLECADKTRVPAGGALAVDRHMFSSLVTDRIESEPNIKVIHEEIKKLPVDGYVVIATGPLTADSLAEEIDRLCGGRLSFFDAAAPIVTADSIDMDRVYRAARYGRGEDDYLNCAFDKESYERFYNELVNAERATFHTPDELKVYEGCMPVEVLAHRGVDTLRYGTMRPVGLSDPKTGKRPYAVVQLRQENSKGTLYNLVGFQTNLKFSEQKRVFSLIPGLSSAEFARYGVMHRNSFIDSPRLLDRHFRLRKDERIFFAGQISGVEGYMESAMSGLAAGHALVRILRGEQPVIYPPETMTGALCSYICDESIKDFQPMGANMGLLPPLADKIKSKEERYTALAQRALEFWER